MVPRNSHQNGVAEHKKRTILEHARSLRIHAGLPKQFWAYEVNTAVYMINREPSMPMNCGILEQIWTGNEVHLNHLRTFDCISYVHIELSAAASYTQSLGGVSSLDMKLMITAISSEIPRTTRFLGTKM